jgi:NAD(P)-dependent dehydrogenase (short-subunit alcohol dehydrogenase family)
VTRRVVLIVGGSSGIGLAAARAFATRGDAVVLAARSVEGLATAERLLRAGGAAEVDSLVTDVNSEADVAALVAFALVRHTRIDVVVHTATVMGYGTIEAMPGEVFESVVDTAIHGTARVARHVLPLFREQQYGTLIVVNSLLGSIAVPQMGAYATSKWGQLGLVRTLQLETRNERHIHVCLVNPGSVNTPIYYQAANFTGRVPRPPIPVQQPEKMARHIVRLVDHPRRLVEAGPVNLITIAGFRFLPFVYERIVGPLFGLAALTRTEAAPEPGNTLAANPSEERELGRWPSP